MKNKSNENFEDLTSIIATQSRIIGRLSLELIEYKKKYEELTIELAQLEKHNGDFTSYLEQGGV